MTMVAIDSIDCIKEGVTYEIIENIDANVVRVSEGCFLKKHFKVATNDIQTVVQANWRTNYFKKENSNVIRHII